MAGHIDNVVMVMFCAPLVARGLNSLNCKVNVHAEMKPRSSDVEDKETSKNLRLKKQRSLQSECIQVQLVLDIGQCNGQFCLTGQVSNQGLLVP